MRLPLPLLLRAALLALLSTHPAVAALYKVPPSRAVPAMKKVVEQDIPKELEAAMCGFRKKGTSEDAAMTTVTGVPLRPAVWRGQSTGDTAG